MKIITLLKIPLLVLLIFSCSSEEKYSFEFVNDDAFTPGTSAQSNMFATDDGKLLMSWINHHENENELVYSVFDDGNWSAPETIIRGEDWFVNFADFPSLAANEQVLFAHHLKSSGPEYFSYDVVMQVSSDFGLSWSAPFIPHRDGTTTEHGFVSTVPYGDGFYSIWLDGRHTSGHHSGGQMQIMGAEITNEGEVKNKVVLNERVCECCQTSLAKTSDGIIAVYRGRTHEEIRDIWIQRYDDGQWQEPKVLFDDNWEIPGCPVNGPVISTNGDNVAVAWYTAAGDQPKARVIFSENGGESFSEPVLISNNYTHGRLDLLWLDENYVLVSMISDSEESTILAVRPVSKTGKAGSFYKVYESRNLLSRASGFPRMALTNDEIWISWTDWDTQPSIPHIKRAVSKVVKTN